MKHNRQILLDFLNGRGELVKVDNQAVSMKLRGLDSLIDFIEEETLKEFTEFADRYDSVLAKYNNLEKTVADKATQMEGLQISLAVANATIRQLITVTEMTKISVNQAKERMDDLVRRISKE